MISEKGLLRLTLLFAVLCWLSLVLADLFLLFAEINGANAGITKEIPQLLLTLYIIFAYLFFKIRIQKAESINFIDLLWHVFSTGLIVSLVQLAVSLFFYLLSDSKLMQNPLMVNFFYHINLGVVIIFLVSTFIVWKRLILYQKNKRLLIIWQIFEYSLLASLLYSFFQIGSQQWLFNGLLGAFVLYGLVLSFNLKWIAYLNFKQKWRSILLLVLVILYLYYFINNLFGFSTEFKLVMDLLDNVYILSIAGFIFLYALISILVILFNLPTSSVFEQKISEVLNFQRLSQSIQKGDSENQVYEVLLESSNNAVFSTSAWLEIYEDDDPTEILKSNITDIKITQVRKSIQDSGIYAYLNKHKANNFQKELNLSKLTTNINDPDYGSVLVMPLIIQERQIGLLVVLKDVSDGFNKEMVNIISSFVNQACISIENFELLTEALQNERYKEELKIASRVQKSLLPHSLIADKEFEMHAFYESADEVGGDYYDFFKTAENKTAVIIGDVSGKGTSASFNMSQMKGVFHSLVQFDLDSKTFFTKANHALSHCLEKTSFITAAYYIIDSKEKSISFSRAGHCPGLFYFKKENRAEYFQNKGMGLGIVRNDSFEKFIDISKIHYNSGDILFLYTDGIIEAKNEREEEFGYDRLSNYLERNSEKSPKEIQDGLIKYLYEFSGTENLEDDYTALIVRFL
ncbi:GAF domain-containing SpoIIE family protein phosphatase [Marivirga sp.]|uniref:GAF domain-containing SpoIIE family protein phosphatase n=1 Tax=Marivirga sp. TaxID=2018662 RepID=UPI002D80D1EF|nr:GAF domain-containing SpoIIE family protein phosphatase [Marivirga sp.]HET8859477.1 GAF domain-containing SpoIIE family protein phosphatase [Marivirga sp.]